MIGTIYFGGERYPDIQARGNAAKFAAPAAMELISPEGKTGYDIGCGPWKFYPDAIGIDIETDVAALPPERVDYIFSSHFLEHYPGRWQSLLDYWLAKVLKPGGILFLYLPNCDYQKYWAYGNKKHIHYLNPAILRGYCENLGKAFFVTEGYDLNGSFYCVIEA